MILLSISARRCNTSECIRIYPKGVIIGKCVCARLGLNEGDYVGVFSDIEHKGDLYLGVAPAANGYPLHRRGKQYHLHSRELAKLILTETNTTSGDCAIFRVGEPIQYHGATVLPIISRINYANL